MTHPQLTHALAQARIVEMRTVAAARHPKSPLETPMVTTVPVTIRFADSYDGPALGALAQLDSAEPPRLPALVAEVRGELRAALSLSDARVIADPFHPTLELVELLRTRAQQLTHEPHPGLRARIMAPCRRARALGLELRG